MLDHGTDGITRQYDLILWEEALHIGIGDTDARSTTCEEFIRNACVGVLLLDECRDAKALCGLERRCTRIAPYPDDDLGLEVSDNISRRDQCTQEVSDDPDIMS